MNYMTSVGSMNETFELIQSKLFEQDWYNTWTTCIKRTIVVMSRNQNGHLTPHGKRGCRRMTNIGQEARDW